MLLYQNCFFLIPISIEFVPKVPINYTPALVLILSRHRTGHRLLFKQRWRTPLTYICVSRFRCAKPIQLSISMKVRSSKKLRVTDKGGKTLFHYVYLVLTKIYIAESRYLGQTSCVGVVQTQRISTTEIVCLSVEYGNISILSIHEFDVSPLIYGVFHHPWQSNQDDVMDVCAGDVLMDQGAHKYIQGGSHLKCKSNAIFFKTCKHILWTTWISSMQNKWGITMLVFELFWYNLDMVWQGNPPLSLTKTKWVIICDFFSYFMCNVGQHI